MDHSNHEMVNLTTHQMTFNRHGFEIGYRNQPYFILAFLDYMLQIELSKGFKVLKFSVCERIRRINCRTYCLISNQ
ncbi:hypothetical protein CR513_36230, partial [Mucuna pruriens]